MMYMTKVYYNNWLAKLILFNGYSTITLGPFILTKEDYLPDHVINGSVFTLVNGRIVSRWE